MKLSTLYVPPKLLTPELRQAPSVDIEIHQGKVSTVRPSFLPPQAIAISAPVEIHAHLDKSYTVREVGAAEGDLFTAIHKTAEHRLRWTYDSLYERMEKALTYAWRNGVRALRTHLDWGRAEPPVSLAVYLDLQRAWQGRLELQFVSLTPLDVYEDKHLAQAIALEVYKNQGVLGAFVYKNTSLDLKLNHLFQLAIQYDLDLDLHVDEGLESDARALQQIALLTQKYQRQGRVICGHACSLSIQEEELAQTILQECATAQIHLVALPTTNLYLQGDWNKTPVQRGITRIKEARAMGIGVSFGIDNVQDAFYPYGCYDPFGSFALGVQVAHLAPAFEVIDMITSSPALAMDLDWDGVIKEGCPADLLLFEAVDEYELIQASSMPRQVLRAGQFI